MKILILLILQVSTGKNTFLEATITKGVKNVLPVGKKTFQAAAKSHVYSRSRDESLMQPRAMNIYGERNAGAVPYADHQKTRGTKSISMNAVRNAYELTSSSGSHCDNTSNNYGQYSWLRRYERISPVMNEY
ncbi:unnamed protein product [Caenorhabditis brenneri]